MTAGNETTDHNRLNAYVYTERWSWRYHQLATAVLRAKQRNMYAEMPIYSADSMTNYAADSSLQLYTRLCWEREALILTLLVTQNQLQLDEDKTEVLLAVPSKLHNIKNIYIPSLPGSICIDGTNIPFSPLVHSLWVILDRTFTFRQYISYICKTPVWNSEGSVQSVIISLLMPQKHSCVLLFCHDLVTATLC